MVDLGLSLNVLSYLPAQRPVQPLHLRFLSSSVSLGFPSFAYGRLRRGVEWIVRGTERMTTRGGNSRPRVVCFQVNHHVGFSFHSSPCHNPSFPHHPSHRPPKGSVSRVNEGPRGTRAVRQSCHHPLTLPSLRSARFGSVVTPPHPVPSVLSLHSCPVGNRPAARSVRGGEGHDRGNRVTAKLILRLQPL